MQYFQGINTIDDAKKRYKELAKTHHPDIGGCVESMKAINTQYEKVLAGVFQSQGKSNIEIDELLKDDAILREKLNAVLMLNGVEIELCGAWIWITGNTMSVKDSIKSAGFWWAKQKKAWYWRKEEDRSFNRKAYSLDDIRKSHGSVSIKPSKQYAIA